MKIEIHLNNGMKFTADVEGYNGEGFTKALNSERISHVNIGDLVLNKHSVLMVLPVDTTSEKE